MMEFYWFISILLAWNIYIQSCEAEPIRGGEFDRQDEVIWQISYQRLDDDNVYKHACGGSLINSKYIVTAAHCFVGKVKPSKNIIEEWEPNNVWDPQKRPTRIVIGTNDLNDPNAGIVKHIDKIFIPKEYGSGKEHTLVADIAVIKLKEPLNRSTDKAANYGFIPLFKSNNKQTLADVYNGKIGYVAGFGAVDIKITGNDVDEQIEYIFDGLRRILPVKMTEVSKCPNVQGIKCIQYANQIKDQDIRGFCKADSGGPLYYKNIINNTTNVELVGVISRGPYKTCDMRETTGKVGKVTFILSYLDFVNRVQLISTDQPFKDLTEEQLKSPDVHFIVLPDQIKTAKRHYFEL